MSYLDAQNRWGEVEERGAFGLLDDGADAGVIRTRANHLERNNGLAQSVLRRSVENFVGPRIALRPASKTKAYNDAVAKRQKFYFSGHHLDVRRLRSFDGLVRLAVWSMLRDGDCGFILLKINGKPQLQFIEGGLIDQPPYAGPNVRDGIEWGTNGQPLAFYIRSYDEYGMFTHTRVAARDFIYLCDNPRGSSTRGMSRFNGSFSMFNNLAGFVDAAVKTARTQNAQAIVAEENTPGGGGIQGRAGNGTVTDSDGNTFRTIPIQGGAVNIVKNVKSMTAFQPTAPGANLDSGVTVFGRFVGLNFGMPYDDVFLDYSKSTYSNSRMRRLAMAVAIELFQIDFKAAFFDRFWPWFTSVITKNGEVDVERPDDAWEYEWTPSARPSNDPLKDAQAAKLQLDMGTEAPQNIAEANGYDWVTLLETIKRNREELQAAGISMATAASAIAATILTPRDQVDAYGVAVRAGAITPQMEDEEKLREVLKLVGMSAAVKAAWKKDGIRRPITINDPEDAKATSPFSSGAPIGDPADPSTGDPPDDEEEPEDPDEVDDEEEDDEPQT
jgi:capsid protein